jgi:hypothetical protein
MLQDVSGFFFSYFRSFNFPSLVMKIIIDISKKDFIRCAGSWASYISITITILTTVQLSILYMKQKVDRACTSQEAHYVSTTLRAQQVNEIYRFVTEVC